MAATGEQLRTRLLKMGFREELMGDMRPPASHYRVESGDKNFYAEFLTPLAGGEIKRGGRRDATARVSGVSVQKLRYLELMLRAPWNVVIARTFGDATSGARRILVPNPAAFLVQKMLIHGRRSVDKRAKDVLYIHDTMETFGENLPEIREQWQRNVKPFLHERAVKRIERASHEYFHDVNDAIREAVRMTLGRNLTPAMVSELCAFGWEQIFD